MSNFVEDQQAKARDYCWTRCPVTSETTDQIVKDTIIATCEEIIEYDVGVVNPNRVYDLRVAITKINEHMGVLIKQAKDSK